MDSTDDTTTKRCPQCEEVKPRDQFSKDKSRNDGLQTRCKACNSAYERANRERDREHHRQYAQRRYAENPGYKEYQKEYRASHIEWRRAYDREWKRNNYDKDREYQKRYYEANKDAIRAKARERSRVWRASNPDKLAEQSHRRRARKRGAGGVCTAADLITIRAGQTDKRGRLICWRCGKPIKDTPHLDHWIPLIEGGTNDPGNLHYMHAHCNLTKQAKHPAEMGRLL